MANTLSATRRALHGLAELVLAGPQYRASRTVRLRPEDGGFGTVAAPSLRVLGGLVVSAEGSTAADTRTCAELATAAGVIAGAPEGVYAGGSGVDPDEVLHIDSASVTVITAGFALGDAALRAFAPGVAAVLWPEHFDLGISLDEVNYGVSAGDAYLAEPYAYVGPWQPRAGAFWNAPFGAARPISALTDLAAFFAEGQRLARP